jgi:NAD(P)-dependent dehydrogenase (short-subunit alcohol dehydrogenase family)
VLFTTSLAPLKDEANIRVNCVCPGVVDTPMLHGARESQSDEQLETTRTRLTGLAILQPEDIADAVISLIVDDSMAGRALLVPNGRPRELWRVPNARPLG